MSSTPFKVDNLEFRDEQAVLTHLRGLSGKLSDSSIAAFYSSQRHTEMLWRNNQGESFEGRAFAEPVATIDQSEVGKFLHRFKSTNDTSLIFEKLLNREASRLYAEGAKGDVVAFVFGSMSTPLFTNAPSATNSTLQLGVLGLSPDTLTDPKSHERNQETLALWIERSSIWFDVELPALLANQAVRTINGIPREQLSQYWESSLYSRQSLRRISKDIGDGIFRNFTSWAPTPEGGPSGGARRGHSDTLNGPTTLTSETSTSFTAPRQSPSTFRISTESIDSSRALFRVHESLPGGVVFSKDLTSNFVVSNIAIDTQTEGTLVINGKLRFETGLSFEELALLLGSYEYNKPLGAVSLSTSDAAKAESIIGTVLRLADKAFGDYVYRDIPLGGFKSVLGTTASRFDIAKLAALDADEVGRALHGLFLDENGTIIAEYKGINFATFGDSLRISDASIGLHGCAFSGSPDQPGFKGGLDAFTAKYPESARRLRSLQDGKQIGSNEIFKKVTEYAAVCALINKLAEVSCGTAVAPTLARLATSLNIGKQLQPLAERMVYDDSSLFQSDHREQEQSKKAFFSLLDRIKGEKNPDTFAQEVGAAFACARLSGISYLMDSLAHEVREKISSLRPSKSTDVTIIKLQKLCAYLATNSIFKPLQETAPSGPRLVCNEREALDQALDAAANGNDYESIEQLCRASEFVGEGRGSNLFEHTGKISRLTQTLCNRGFGVRLASRLALAIGRACHDAPELTSSVPLEYMAALGFSVSELMRQGIPLKTLINEIREQIATKDEALMSTQLILGIVSKLPEVSLAKREEATAASALCHAFRKMSRGSVTASERIVTRCVVLGQIFKPRNIMPVEEVTPNGWRSSGLIGIDRLKIESEHYPMDSSLNTQYREIVNTLVERCRKDVLNVPDQPEPTATVVKKIASTLYGQQLGFGLGGRSLLADALRERALDCDTSAFIFADAIKSLGIDCSLIHTPGHLLLRVQDSFVETAQGFILSERALRAKYGNFIYEGSTNIFGASISHQSVAERLRDPAKELRALENARSFTPGLGHLLANMAVCLEESSEKAPDGRFAQVLPEHLEILREIDRQRETDPFLPSLVKARGILERRLPAEHASNDGIVIEYVPELVRDNTHKSAAIFEEQGVNLEKSILANLLLLRNAVGTSLRHSLKATTLDDIHAFRTLGSTSAVMKIGEISSAKNLRSIQEQQRLGNPSVVLNNAVLAVNASVAEGLDIDAVSLYSVAMWEDSRSHVGLARRVDERQRRADILGCADDVRELVKIDPSNSEYAYQSIMSSLIVSDYDAALRQISASSRVLPSEASRMLLERTVRARDHRIPLSETVDFARKWISAGALDIGAALIKFIENKHPSHPALPELKETLESATLLTTMEPITKKNAPEQIQRRNQAIGDLGRGDRTKSGELFRTTFSDPSLDPHTKAILLPMFAETQREVGNAEVVLRLAEDLLNENHMPSGFANLYREIILCSCALGDMKKAQIFLSTFERMARQGKVVGSFRRLMSAEADYAKAIYMMKSKELTLKRQLNALERASIILKVAPSARSTSDFVISQLGDYSGTSRLVAQIYR